MALCPQAGHRNQMKSFLRALCSPILSYFESGEEAFSYKSSHRKILITVGALFLVLSLGSLYTTIITAIAGGLIPTVVFFIIAMVCEIVGLLGNDRAVAKIWKSSKES